MKIVVLLIVFVVQQSMAEVSLDKLGRKLMSDYVSYVYPGPINLSVGVAIIAFDYDANTEMLTTNLWERYAWNDTRLIWDPKDYNGIRVIRLPAEMIWTPDIVVYNHWEAANARKDTNVLVHSDGQIMWIPPATYKTHCPKSTTLSKPALTMAEAFGAQSNTMTCLIKFGSWTYDGFSLPLQPDEFVGSVDLSSYVNSQRYELLSANSTIVTSYYACCAEPYQSYNVELKFNPRDSA